MRSEALSIWYGINTFTAWDVSVMAAWVEKLPDPKIRMLMSVRPFNGELCWDKGWHAARARRADKLVNYDAWGLLRPSAIFVLDVIYGKSFWVAIDDDDAWYKKWKAMTNGRPVRY